MIDSSPLVALVDDDESVCRALTRSIRCAGYRVEAYGSAGEFLRQLGNPPEPACLVLDLHLPDQGGLRVQQVLAETGIILPVVFISGDGESAAIVAAMRAGAEDFLMKPVSDTGLHNAISRAVARCPSLRKEDAERKAVFKRLARLTARERDVLNGVLTGHLNKQIAFGALHARQLVRNAPRCARGNRCEQPRRCQVICMKPSGTSLDLFA
ncbi:response regulator [Paraburkholderia sediminicola]|uniref:response regulator transcription factor n=1 Tax=Paraburkholderia sediminicola TaxID=458836 RepID=UPI0038BC7B5F